MEFFKIRRDIPFMRHALVFNIISLVTFVLAVFFLVTRGLHLSIEFKGGTVMEVNFSQAADPDKVRDALTKAGFQDIAVTTFGSSQDVLVRMPLAAGESSAKTAERAFKAICGERAAATDNANKCGGDADRVELRRVEFVGGQVGKELAADGALALLFVSIGIVLYLAIRFEWKFGVAGIIANLHDVVIILGVFAFFQWEFSLAVLAGVLAILGYSVNESVVIFDRIRENFRKMRRATTNEIIDNAITRTISRTIITHGSTQAMVLAMFFFGGPTLHYFAVALTIGICFGIYSSVFVAAAIVKWLGIKREDLVKAEKKAEGAQVMP